MASKTYFIDYKGMIEPSRSTREHIGVCAIPGPKATKVLLLRPGLQEVPAALWEEVRKHGEIGWDPASKTYKGSLVRRGAINVYEPKNGAMDWASIAGGLDDLARRTTVVSVLESMLKYAESQQGMEYLASRLREHIKACSTDFDDNPVPADRLVPLMEVA